MPSPGPRWVVPDSPGWSACAPSPWWPGCQWCPPSLCLVAGGPRWFATCSKGRGPQRAQVRTCQVVRRPLVGDIAMDVASHLAGISLRTRLGAVGPSAPARTGLLARSDSPAALVGPRLAMYSPTLTLLGQYFEFIQPGCIKCGAECHKAGHCTVSAWVLRARTRPHTAPPAAHALTSQPLTSASICDNGIGCALLVHFVHSNAILGVMPIAMA